MTIHFYANFWDRTLARRLVGLGAKQIGEDVALLGRELTLIARGVDDRGALIQRHGTQILKGALDDGLTIGRQGQVIAPGLAHLHLLLRRHVFEHFAARQTAFALGLGHLIQAVQLLHQALLRGGGQTVEAGVIAQQPLLILDGKALMVVEPVAKVAGRRRAGIGVSGIRAAELAVAP